MSAGKFDRPISQYITLTERKFEQSMMTKQETLGPLVVPSLDSGRYSPGF